MNLLKALLFSLFLSLPAFAAGNVNINTADAATIAKELNGIGVKKAEAIVAYRQEHGAFKSADELTQVKGIGAKTVEKNRDVITVEDLSEPTAKPLAAQSIQSTQPAQ